MGNLPNETSGQNRYVTLFRQPRRVQIHRSKRGREASALTGWRVSFTQSESAGASPPRPWPADRVERWPIGRLIPYANNPRLHTEADRDKIATSILKWGWTMPVLADEDGVLLVGHARVDAAAKLKLTSIPVIVAKGWTEDEKRAYRLADNQLAARAGWDPDLLNNELRALEFAGFNLDLIGFQPDRLAEILAGLGSSGLTDPDSIPQAPDQPVTGRGDIWVLGDHRVGCGDSTNAADVAPVLNPGCLVVSARWSKSRFGSRGGFRRRSGRCRSTAKQSPAGKRRLSHCG